MKYLALIFTFLFLSLGFMQSKAQTQVDTCIAKLRSSEFEDVFRARTVILEKYQQESIPKLIILLKDTAYVKLNNTADLIYPGAKAFYGHGWIVNYHIDLISVRAAWILEEITFQNFGFLSQKPIDEKSLIILHKSDYQNYLKASYHLINYNDTTLAARLIKSRLFLAENVSKWWDKNKKHWSKLQALKEALASRDEHREELALHYLRFGNDFETPADANVRKSYYSQLKSLVVKIKNSKSSESEQAGYLLRGMIDVK